MTGETSKSNGTTGAANAWAAITRRWGANGGETLSALRATLTKKAK